ncbi:MAG: hypothetical protein ACREFM_16735 [Hypericibacter sp.]
MEAAIAAFVTRSRALRGLRFVLPLLALAGSAGLALGDDFVVRPYQPAPAPQSMAPPPAPARPPTAGISNFGSWQKEDNHFRWQPGQQSNDPNQAPIWVPGQWGNDAQGNQIYRPGYWR